VAFDTFALPRFIREKAEEFYCADFTAVKIHIGFEPLDYAAVAFAQGDDLYFLPGYFSLASEMGLKLLGHELAHVVQQRSGSCVASSHHDQGLLNCAALEFGADCLAQAFFQYNLGDPAISRVRAEESREPCAGSPAGTLIQPKVWEPNLTPGSDDELFWHATTFESVRTLYHSPKIDIARGNGWMGPGFYVTTAKSDYQKMMAFRNLQGNFKDENDRENYGHPMYLLCMLVEGFWRLNAEVKDGYDKPSGVVDFIGIRWSGDYGTEERTIKKPGAMPYGERKYARMGAYREKPLFQLGVKPVGSASPWHSNRYTADFADDVEESSTLLMRESVLNRLWSLARENNWFDSTENSILDFIVQHIGPRKAFKATLKELAFTNPGLGDKIHIVGAKAFAHRTLELPKQADSNKPLQSIGGFRIRQRRNSTSSPYSKNTTSAPRLILITINGLIWTG